MNTTSGDLTGNGTVFKITPAGVFTTIYTFQGTDGASPSGIIQGSDGNFYGTTTMGGVGAGGIVFRLTAGGGLGTLLSFPIQMDGFSKPQYGASPYALMQASDGNFYGLTTGFGTSVFKISPSGTVSFIYTFPELYASADLIQGADGNFYGALHFIDGLAGLLFKLTPGGVRTTLHNFTHQADGISPLSLLQAADGNFYGTSDMFTYLSQGVLFEYSIVGGFQVLHDFGPSEGAIPLTLLQSRDGSLWGTSFQGGGQGAGDVFRYQFLYNCSNTVPPTITSVASASAYGGGYPYFASGSWLEIKGANLADPNDPRLSSATNPGQWTPADFNSSNAPTSLDGISVSINGKAAYVWYISPTQLNLQAPEDALIGNVAISATNCKAASLPFVLTRQALAPGLLAPSSFASGPNAIPGRDLRFRRRVCAEFHAWRIARRKQPRGEIWRFDHRLWSRLRRRHAVDSGRHDCQPKQYPHGSGDDLLRLDPRDALLLRTRWRIHRPVRVLRHGSAACQRRLSCAAPARRHHRSANRVPDSAKLMARAELHRSVVPAKVCSLTKIAVLPGEGEKVDPSCAAASFWCPYLR